MRMFPEIRANNDKVIRKGMRKRSRKNDRKASTQLAFIKRISTKGNAVTPDATPRDRECHQSTKKQSASVARPKRNASQWPLHTNPSEARHPSHRPPGRFLRIQMPCPSPLGRA